MSLIDHLQELRRRLIISIGAVVLCSGVGYFFAQDLVHIITAPAGKLYYMNPAEAFKLAACKGNVDPSWGEFSKWLVGE